MPIIFLWIVVPILVIWVIYKLIKIFFMASAEVYEAKEEDKAFEMHEAKVKEEAGQPNSLDKR